MENKSLIKYRWFWPGQDRKAEEWLRQMSLDGWHLRSVGFNKYTFEKGESIDYVYRMDFRTDSGQTHEEYVQFFEEVGWEYLGNLGTWRYFRQPTSAGKKAEIYTDEESKIQKYQRQLQLFVPSLSVMIIVLGMFKKFPGRHPNWFVIFTITLFVLWSIYVVITSIMIWRRINELKSNKRL